MTTEVTPARSTVSPRRTDPERDLRRLALYFVGLIAVYVVGVLALRPTEANGFSQNWALVVMAAPTVGALLTRFIGPGVIQWGRFSWSLVLCLVAALLPVAVGLLGYRVATVTGLIDVNEAALAAALAGAAGSIAVGMITATGEEIGWRGFLWPLLRRRFTFIPTTLMVTAIWWAYHVPVIILGWYGSLGGIPAFTVAIIGFGAFVGVLTDRSQSIWPSVVAHGGWNALVATAFVGAFTGNASLLGEFGWVAAASMLLLGAVSVAWHLITGGGPRRAYPPRFGSGWTAGSRVEAPVG